MPEDTEHDDTQDASQRDGLTPADRQAYVEAKAQLDGLSAAGSFVPLQVTAAESTYTPEIGRWIKKFIDWAFEFFFNN